MIHFEKTKIQHYNEVLGANIITNIPTKAINPPIISYQSGTTPSIFQPRSMTITMKIPP